MGQRGNSVELAASHDEFVRGNFEYESSWDEFPTYDEATGEEHGFELSLAIGELETTDERARRRQHDAAAALAHEYEATHARLRSL